jgi:hypothetical protein
MAPIALIAPEFHYLPFHDSFHGQAIDRRYLPATSVPALLPQCETLGETWRAAVCARTRELWSGSSAVGAAALRRALIKALRLVRQRERSSPRLPWRGVPTQAAFCGQNFGGSVAGLRTP